MVGSIIELPALELSDGAIATSCALGWLAWSLLIGYGAQRLDPHWLAGFTALDGPLPWVDDPQWCQRVLGIRRWKDHLPEAGAFFPGGRSKRSLSGGEGPGTMAEQQIQLERFLAETRRAELVHLALLPFALVTALWCPPWAVGVNLVFAALFNLPCLLVQRFNRRRLLRLLGRLKP